MAIIVISHVDIVYFRKSVTTSMERAEIDAKGVFMENSVTKVRTIIFKVVGMVVLKGHSHRFRSNFVCLF
jgi:hypothetical protein